MTADRRRAPSRRVRLLRAAAVLGLLVAGTGLVNPSAATASGSPVTKSVTVERHYVNADGTTTVVDPTHKVSLTVGTTTDLRSLQLVHVSWSGARPTAGIVGDQNSDLAQNEEYPMVLLECRGVDSATAALAQRLSPRTCWTQFADERFSYGYDGYPAWRSDANAPAADRAAVVNSPAAADLPDQCKNILLGTANQHWLPFNGADGLDYAGGPFGCDGQAPEAAPANLSSLSLPSNETFGVTNHDGTGQADFDIFTAEDHSSLGCSQHVSCSLVAIPIEGIDCDSSGTLLPVASRPSADDLPGAQSNCETAGRFTAGQSIPPGQSGADAVDGSLWWSPSNWANRITVPLTFAPPDNACGLANAQSPVNVYGSELLIQATSQWAPVFCLDSKLFNFNHVQTPEPQAASLLNTGNIQAAFISRPPDGGFARPTVTAPVAVSGFGVAFAVDDAQRRSVAHLNLTPRLLAKLLTESYPDLIQVRDTHPGLGSNPLNITADPEFQALNPNIPQKIQDAAATLLTLNTDSDVTWALTSYINADPDARAWLDGAADPWGMKVNPAYKAISLPVDNWPLRDAFEPTFSFGQNPCFWSNPVPFLPLVAAPTARLYSIGQDMQFALAQSQTVCVTPSPDPTSLAGAKLVAQGRQQVGARFMLGVVSLGDAAREGLHLAGLETHTSSSAPGKFTDAAGRTFVEPGKASLAAAAGQLKPDGRTGTWPVPYQTLRSDAGAAQAYPGTMVVYCAVPTRGLKTADAAHFAQLLRFAAGPGQQPGTGQGKLPDGFLPMTSTNGLAALADYTQRAATAVAAQQGALPALTAPDTTTAPPAGSGGSGGGSTGGGGSSTGPAAGGGAAGAPAVSRSDGTRTGTGSRTGPVPSSSSGTPSAAAVAPVGYTRRLSTGASGVALPALAGVVLVAGAAAAFVRRRGRTPIR